jgi:hypothetical protein
MTQLTDAQIVSKAQQVFEGYFDFSRPRVTPEHFVLPHTNPRLRNGLDDMMVETGNPIVASLASYLSAPDRFDCGWGVSVEVARISNRWKSDEDTHEQKQHKLELISWWDFDRCSSQRIVIEIVRPRVLAERNLVGYHTDTLLAQSKDKSQKSRYERCALHVLSVWTRVVLHELGHLVLHGKDLLTGQRPDPIPPYASPGQERQAWLFANHYATEFLDKVTSQPKDSMIEKYLRGVEEELDAELRAKKKIPSNESPEAEAKRRSRWRAARLTLAAGAMFGGILGAAGGAAKGVADNKHFAVWVENIAALHQKKIREGISAHEIRDTVYGHLYDKMRAAMPACVGDSTDHNFAMVMAADAYIQWMARVAERSLRRGLYE